MAHEADVADGVEALGADLAASVGGLQGGGGGRRLVLGQLPLVVPRALSATRRRRARGAREARSADRAVQAGARPPVDAAADRPRPLLRTHPGVRRVLCRLLAPRCAARTDLARRRRRRSPPRRAASAGALRGACRTSRRSPTCRRRRLGCGRRRGALHSATLDPRPSTDREGMTSHRERRGAASRSRREVARAARRAAAAAAPATSQEAVRRQSRRRPPPVPPPRSLPSAAPPAAMISRPSRSASWATRHVGGGDPSRLALRRPNAPSTRDSHRRIEASPPPPRRRAGARRPPAAKPPRHRAASLRRHCPASAAPPPPEGEEKADADPSRHPLSPASPADAEPPTPLKAATPSPLAPSAPTSRGGAGSAHAHAAPAPAPTPTPEARAADKRPPAESLVARNPLVAALRVGRAERSSRCSMLWTPTAMVR